MLNSSLAGAIAEAQRSPAVTALLGAIHGMRGLLNDNLVELGPLTNDEIDNLRLAPGSAIGSSRLQPPPDGLDQLLTNFKRRNVRYFFYTGGNGSMETALDVQQHATERGYELRVLGIPKTIDNDLHATDHTPGHASAARFFAHAVRDIGKDNEALPPPVCVVEVLGRNAGWIAAATALARDGAEDAPHLIYFPERPVTEDALMADVDRIYSRIGRVLLVACEGQTNERGEPFGADVDKAQSTVHRLASNLGHSMARLISQRTGLRARAEKPGLLGRSCAALASEVDRAESYECGRAAVQAALQGESGVMVAIRRTSNHPYRFATELVPLESVARKERLFPLEWIAPEANGVLPPYFDYIRPLVGDVRPHFRLPAKSAALK